MYKKNILLFLMLIALMGILLACTQPPGGGTSPAVYKVTYEGNGNTGGAVPIDGNTYERGETVTVLDNTGSLEKVQDGISFFFIGWNTAVDGSGTDYAPSTTFSMGSADVTLYAQWSALRATGPAGGLIFYDAGSVQSWGRYLEAAPSDQSTGQVWIEGGSTQTTLNGNTSTAIGTGRANSDYIIAQTGHTGSAAKLCLDYVDGIFDDWFLPSLDELKRMYWVLKHEGVGGFATHAYWSSSEDDATKAFGVDFLNGNWGSSDKSEGKGYTPFHVRAVRAF